MPLVARASVKLYGQVVQLCKLQLKTKSIFQGQFKRAMSSQSRLDLGGIYPPIATPFQENEDIAYDKLEHNFNLWNQAPFRGIVL